MSDLLPTEIQMEIIKRVPDLTSLIRFRSVSKEWKSFIDSSEFITSYGFRDTKPPSFIIRYNDPHDGETFIYFVDDNTNFTRQEQEEFDPTVSVDSSVVIGSSSGLWSLYGFNKKVGREMVVAWNPSLRKSVGVVVPSVDNSVFETVFGFGVCPITSDPTIVKISYMRNMEKVLPWDVQVFTLSSGVWNTIRSDYLPRASVRLKSPSQVVIDRFVYWVAYDTVVAGDGYMIMSFDLFSKEFNVVDVPDNVRDQFPIGFLISKVRESLVLFGSIDDEEFEEVVCGVWMMEHDGVFRRLFVIENPDSSLMKVLGFRRSGEPIMETQILEEWSSVLEEYEPNS